METAEKTVVEEKINKAHARLEGQFSAGNWKKAQKFSEKTIRYINETQEQNSSTLKQHEQCWLKAETECFSHFQTRLTSLLSQENAINASYDLVCRAKTSVNENNYSQALEQCHQAETLLDALETDPPGFEYQEHDRFINMLNTQNKINEMLTDLKQAANEQQLDEQELNQYHKDNQPIDGSATTPVTIRNSTATSPETSPKSQENNPQAIVEQNNTPDISIKKKPSNALNTIASFFKQANCCSSSAQQVVPHR